MRTPEKITIGAVLGIYSRNAHLSGLRQLEIGSATIASLQELVFVNMVQ
jgi:hypothetical protein